MASPVADSYSCASGGDIAAGRYRHSLWRRSQSINTWAEIPSTLLSSIDPANDPTLNPNYPSRAPWGLLASGNTNSGTINGVMQPWCGGVENNGEFWLPLGGGHQDSANNAPYKINLATDSPVWTCPRPPSGSLPLIAGGLPAGSTPQNNSFLLDDGLQSTGVYADGRPRSIHSYRVHCFVPGVGILMPAQGGNFSPAGTQTDQTWIMNTATGEWVQKTSSNAGMGSALGGSACYDSLRGRVLWLGAGNALPMRNIDVSTGVSTQHSVYGATTSGDVSITYIQDYDIVFQVNGLLTNKFCIRDAATGAITYPSVTGTPQSIVGSTGCAWVPSIGMVFCVGLTLYSLSPTGNPKTDPWAWGTLTQSGMIPTDTSSGGAYSKFGYSKRLGGLYRFTDSTTRPWFFATE